MAAAATTEDWKDEPQLARALLLLRQERFAEVLDLVSELGEPSAGVLVAGARAATALADPTRSENLSRRAVAGLPSDPRGYAILAEVLRSEGRATEAEGALQAGLRAAPADEALSYALAGLYWVQQRHGEATAVLDALLRRRPQDALLKSRLAGLLLAVGDFERGWALYEGRYDRAEAAPDRLARPELAFPEWRGEALEGRSILVLAEQGYGDQIQFCRYANVLKARGARRVTIACRAALAPLMESLEGVDQVILAQDGSSPPDHDFWVLMLSLPHLTGTRLSTIPSMSPYLSVPAPYRERWAPLIAPEGLRVGLVWKGNSENPADGQRSLPSLRSLRPLWDVPEIAFISLQMGAAGLEAATAPPDQPLVRLGDQIRDFGDTAAIVEQLDLLISVDSAPAHLAGALGKPAFVLLPYPADFRWLLNRSDSLWYPTLRLFRRERGEDWSRVVERLVSELRAVAKARR
ncbi:MAG TPA: tetratricopeptide repeat protein [Phenylobacterium sp.]